MSISAVVTTCNEAEYVDHCLKSLEWVDEIVVVDLESGDDTVDRCRRYTDRIVTHRRVPVVEMVRDFAISRATSDWVLVLDPDERVSEGLREALMRISADPDSLDGYYLPRQTFIFGRQVSYCGWGKDQQLRFFRRGKCSWPSTVHSVPVINGEVGHISTDDGFLVHDNYRTVSQFVEKMNRYTDQEARRLRDNGRPFHWLKLFYQPGKEFCNRYVRLQGYRDGLVGLFLALLMAFYMQLAYVKLWELYRADVDTGAKGSK